MSFFYNYIVFFNKSSIAPIVHAIAEPLPSCSFICFIIIPVYPLIKSTISAFTLYLFVFYVNKKIRVVHAIAEPLPSCSFICFIIIPVYPLIKSTISAFTLYLFVFYVNKKIRGNSKFLSYFLIINTLYTPKYPS